MNSMEVYRPEEDKNTGVHYLCIACYNFEQLKGFNAVGDESSSGLENGESLYKIHTCTNAAVSQPHLGEHEICTYMCTQLIYCRCIRCAYWAGDASTLNILFKRFLKGHSTKLADEIQFTRRHEEYWWYYCTDDVIRNISNWDWKLPVVIFLTGSLNYKLAKPIVLGVMRNDEGRCSTYKPQGNYLTNSHTINYSDLFSDSYQYGPLTKCSMVWYQPMTQVLGSLFTTSLNEWLLVFLD